MDALTASQLYVILNLARRERLSGVVGSPAFGRSVTTAGKGFSGAAIASLRRRGLVRTDFIALTSTNYIELTELGRQVAGAELVFNRREEP